MTDKRSPRDDFPAPKRAKTFPLIQPDEDGTNSETEDKEDDIVVGLDRRSTALGLETEAEVAPLANHAAETSGALSSDDAAHSLPPGDLESPAGQSRELEVTGSGPSSPTAGGPETEDIKTNRVTDEGEEERSEPPDCYSPSSSTHREETSDQEGDQDHASPHLPRSPEPRSASPEPPRPVSPQSNELQVAGSGSSPAADRPETECPKNLAADEGDEEWTEPPDCYNPASFTHWEDTSDQELDRDDLFPHISNPGPWTAPPEPLRPVNPYNEGQKLMVQRHTPAPPFGLDYPDYPGIRQPVYDKELRTLTQVELCLQNPPMEGETRAAGEPPRVLHITGKIRVKDDGGAQLVICRLDDEPDEYYVAKIYDSLYYGFSDRMWSDQPRDVADEADKDYCREAAAYAELDAQFGGEEIPKYHGSWTFEVPLDLPAGSTVRNVRMVLMERVPGRTMIDVKPDPYPESVRLDALARILEALQKIVFAGVRHGDFSQRNIMLCDGDSADTIGRIAIIDFNFATVTRLDDFEERWGEPHGPKEEKPRNPIEQWWDGGLYGGFGEWLPASWEQRVRPLQEWIYQRWGKSEDFLAPKKDLKWDEENNSRPFVTW